MSGASERTNVMSRAFSGREASDLTVDRLARDELEADDVRIHPDTLEHQARVAERHGNPQLAANFRRAAELALVPEDELMAMYEALRPHRSSAGELEALILPALGLSLMNLFQLKTTS